MAIPPGGGFDAGLEFLSNPQKYSDVAKAAEEFAIECIALIRNAPEPNQFKASSDEEIAAEILWRVRARPKER